MKYVSIDIETTGLNPEENNILEIGAIIEDTSIERPRQECPTFHCYLDYPSYNGNPFALALNVDIFKKIIELKKNADQKLLLTPSDVAINFYKFLQDNGIQKVVPAGKNFGSFDLQFLKRLPNWDIIKMNHRQLDPTMYFVNFETDVAPPDLATCKKIAGLPELVTHQALDDAWDVITLLRIAY